MNIIKLLGDKKSKELFIKCYKDNVIKKKYFILKDYQEFSIWISEKNSKYKSNYLLSEIKPFISEMNNDELNNKINEILINYIGDSINYYRILFMIENLKIWLNLWNKPGFKIYEKCKKYIDKQNKKISNEEISTEEIFDEFNNIFKNNNLNQGFEYWYEIYVTYQMKKIVLNTWSQEKFTLVEGGFNKVEKQKIIGGTKNVKNSNVYINKDIKNATLKNDIENIRNLLGVWIEDDVENKKYVLTNNVNEWERIVHKYLIDNNKKISQG